MMNKLPYIPQADMTQQDSYRRLRRIGSLCLWVAIISLVALILIPVLLSVPGEGYLELVSNLVGSRRNLGMVMLLVGLALVTATAVTTWFIALYSTFRIAGPLYRFSRNIELIIDQGQSPIIGIRTDDYLQAECQLLAETAGVLDNHYRKMDHLVGELNTLLGRTETANIDAVREAINALKECDEELALDD